jgi:hypothetical protein
MYFFQPPTSIFREKDGPTLNFPYSLASFSKSSARSSINISRFT